VETYSTSRGKAIVAYDSTLKCLTLAYKQNKNNYYILKL